MSKETKRKTRVSPIYTFAIVWSVMALIFPLYKGWGLLLAAVLSLLCSLLASFISGRVQKNRDKKAQTPKEKKTEAAAQEKSFGPEVDPIINEGKMALSEMGRLYASIQEPAVKEKINEIMMVTDKIVQDAVADPSDIPQIKKFMNYYLPTTIKLLNTYDRMSAQGIQGENLGKSMQSINDMLDEAIAAYKKRLDALFANQAMDIEADIKVMNTMLAREGLSGEKDFDIQEQKGQTT